MESITFLKDFSYNKDDFAKAGKQNIINYIFFLIQHIFWLYYIKLQNVDQFKILTIISRLEDWFKNKANIARLLKPVLLNCLQKIVKSLPLLLGHQVFWRSITLDFVIPLQMFLLFL